MTKCQFILRGDRNVCTHRNDNTANNCQLHGDARGRSQGINKAEIFPVELSEVKVNPSSHAEKHFLGFSLLTLLNFDQATLQVP